MYGPIQIPCPFVKKWKNEEIKDDKGNIVQQEKSLTAEEFGQIATAILESGLIDKHILKTIKAKAILNKLQPFRKGWIASLDEGLRKISSSIHIKKNTTNNKVSKDVENKLLKVVLKC